LPRRRSAVSAPIIGATEKVDWPILVNLRLDQYERTGMFNGKDNGLIAYYTGSPTSSDALVFPLAVMET
jgi:hypothetical protein